MSVEEVTARTGRAVDIRESSRVATTVRADLGGD
jgi:hypothetical protein